MEPPPVALALVCHAGEIFLRRLDDTAGIDQWTIPAGDEGDSPEQMAAAALDDETRIDSSRARRRTVGKPIDFGALDEFRQADTDPGCERHGPPGVDTPVRIYPVLFDYEVAQSTEGTPGTEWIPGPALLDRQSPWPLWVAYDRVRPTLHSIRADTDHGSTALSIRALEVLRDEAALLSRDNSNCSNLDALVCELMTVRPSMTVVANRIGRAVAASAESLTPEQVESAAHGEIRRAIDADRNAAELAGERIEGVRVATLSRSGTVLRTLQTGGPSAVLVAESRPGGEGAVTARQVSDIAATTLTSDAAFPTQLREWDAGVLLVGADSVLPDGGVVNKVGTYGAAVAAREHDIEVVVVTASDKISPTRWFDPEPRDGSSVAGNTEDVEIANPTFEVTPASCIDALLTEDGPLERDEIRDIASNHASRRRAFEQ